MSDYQDDGSNTDDRGHEVVKICIAFIVIPIAAIILRCWSRAISGGPKSPSAFRFWWDDWLALMTLPFAVAQCIIGIYWTSIGLGKHSTDVSPTDITKGLKLFYAGYIIYNMGISLSKLSALAFYARVFARNNNKTFFRVLQCTAIFTIMIWLIGFIVDAFQCVPVRKFWMPELEGQCINTWHWWLANGVISITLDVWILLLPLPILWGLQLQASRKIFITVMFLFGYCVVVIAIGRLIAVKQVGNKLQDDVDYALVPVAFWLISELSISVLSICLPAIFILFKRALQHGPSSLFSRTKPSEKRPVRRYIWPSSHGVKAAADDTFPSSFISQNLERCGTSLSTHEYFAVAYKGPTTAKDLRKIDLSSMDIQVCSEIDVVSELVVEVGGSGVDVLKMLPGVD